MPPGGYRYDTCVRVPSAMPKSPSCSNESVLKSYTPDPETQDSPSARASPRVSALPECASTGYQVPVAHGLQTAASLPSLTKYA